MSVRANIEKAFAFSAEGCGKGSTVVVTGTSASAEDWRERLSVTAASLFGGFGGAGPTVLSESRSEKARQGNFLGMLVSWAALEQARPRPTDEPGRVVLMGMDVGRGRRLAPLTESNGCSKASLVVTPPLFPAGEAGRLALSSLEMALFYFRPVAEALANDGFRGLLLKWGDETQIPSVEMERGVFSGVADADIIKFVSSREVTEDLSVHKDRVLYDSGNGSLVDVIARSVPGKRLSPAEGRSGEGLTTGISLGPVAFSNAFLETAWEVFRECADDNDVTLDLDPYLLMALVADDSSWEENVRTDESLKKVLKEVPDLRERAWHLRSSFRKVHGRELVLKAFDLGEGLYWADMGRHKGLREAFLAWTGHAPSNAIARRVADITASPADGNIVMDSVVGPDVKLDGSVIIDSVIAGKSDVRGSVVVSSRLREAHMTDAFAFNSVRHGRTHMARWSGLYGSLGAGDLALDEGMRHVSLLTPSGPVDMTVHEGLDLKRDENYDRPVLGNTISFKEAFGVMEGTGRKELARRRMREMDRLERINTWKERSRPLRFGTSGLRAEVSAMTDMECYINTRGFLRSLKADGGPLRMRAVALAGDRRESTPRIMAAVARAARDEGHEILCCGLLPSPALAFFAFEKSIPGIMVTGSHIPAGRNGIKFTKPSGEVLKSDEALILEQVGAVREEEYAREGGDSLFKSDGMFKDPEDMPGDRCRERAEELFMARYVDAFPGVPLKGTRVVVYEHSAVGRELLARLLGELGAEVVTVGRSDSFVPVDTEKVDGTTREKFREWAREHTPFAVVSTDGDSDRPLLSDETGEILAGDKLGALTAFYLKPDVAALPVTTNSAVVEGLAGREIEIEQTRIGSPYVIKAMLDSLCARPETHVVGWEANGGFLLGSDIPLPSGQLKALPTRDAVIAILCPLFLAREREVPLSELIKGLLPERYTDAGVVDDTSGGCERYTADVGRELVGRFSPEAAGRKVRFSGAAIETAGRPVSPRLRAELSAVKEELEGYFKEDPSLGGIEEMDLLDGVRLRFSDGCIVHLRPSGNAPEFRLYAEAPSAERARHLVALKDTLLPRMIEDLEKHGTGERG